MKGVTKGWRGFTEINTVTYDRTLTTIGDMEQALKKAGTYLKTMPDD